MSHRRSPLLILALLAACTGPEITPKAGTWSFEDVILTSNTCKGAGSTPDGEFTLTVLGDGRFTIEADALMNALDCSHGGDEFTCPETLLAKIESTMFDAELLITVEVDGTLTSESEFSASEVIRQSCTGADCDQLIAAGDLTLPCESNLTFNGQLKD